MADYMEKANNLSDVANKVTATANLRYKANNTAPITHAVERAVDEKLLDFVNALDYDQRYAAGVLNTLSDFSSSLQYAIDENPGAVIYVPAGTYVIKNSVLLKPGQTLVGAGRANTIFDINYTHDGHNGDVFGYFVFRGSDSGRMQDFHIRFYQPNDQGMTRANIHHYPPAICAANSINFIIERVRISKAWVGIHAPGNVGGYYIDEVESCSFASYQYAKYTASVGTIKNTNQSDPDFGTYELTVSAVASGVIQTNAMAYGREGASSHHYRIKSQSPLDLQHGESVGGPGRYRVFRGGDAANPWTDTPTHYQLEAGLVLDGSRDFTRIGRYRHYFVDVSPTTHLASVLFDQATCAIAMGYSDGFMADTLAIFKAKVVFTPDATGGGSPFTINNIQFDLEGSGLYVYGGNVHIKYVETTGSSLQATPIFLVEAQGAVAEVVIDYLDFVADSMTIAPIVVNKGNFIVLGGDFRHTEFTSGVVSDPQRSPCVWVNGAKAAASIFNVFCSIPDVDRVPASPNGNIWQANSASYFYCQSGGMRLVNVRGSAATDTANREGYIFEYLPDNIYHADSTYNTVRGCDFAGWPYRLAFTTSLGYYDLSLPQTSSNVSPRFPADASSAWGVSNATYYNYFIRKGNKVEFWLYASFDVNDYTSDPPIGPFELTMNDLPVSRSGQNMPVSITSLNKVTFDANSFVTAFINTASRGVRFNINKSGVSAVEATKTFIPSGTTGVKITVGGFYYI